MKKYCFLIALNLLASNYALSAVGLPSAKILVIENGWYGEGLAIHLDSGGVAGCVAPLDFGVEAAHPAYKDIVAIALSAMASGANVELVVEPSVCVVGGRTKVVSIRIKKS